MADRLKVTQGHKIVADGWAWAYNLRSHPHPPHTHLHTHSHIRGLENAPFYNFQLDHLDGPRDGPKDQWMDGQSLG